MSFRDLYTYLYLDQQEIDRSIAHDIDKSRDPKRRMTFELLYGLMTAELAQLRTSRLEAETNLRQTTDLVSNARQFLQRLQVHQPNEIAAARTLVAGELANVERELTLLRSDAQQATAAAAPARAALALSEAELVAAQDAVAFLHREGQALERVRAQVELDVQRIMKALVAGQAFAAYEFIRCPRCSQGLEHAHRAPGDCRVCGQPEPDDVGQLALDEERTRLEAQGSETESLLSQNASALQDAQTRETQARRHLDSARSRLDDATRDALSPYLDRVTTLSAQVGELRGRDAALRESFRAANEIVKLEENAAEQRSQLKALDGEIKTEAQHVEGARAQVRELSRQFDEILRGLDMPWYTSASIDDSTYLPVVNGGSMQALSSGGMKTLVSVAYYVANLSYAVSGGESRLPRFMVIDSPRKNFGLGSSDREHAGLVYRRFLALQQIRNSPGSHARSFQLIVADNDLPSDVARTLGTDRILTLSYESPLIDDLTHPGPDVDTIGT